MLRSLRSLYVYTVLVLTYLGKRAARSFMHKCISSGGCFSTGMKKPALGGLSLKGLILLCRVENLAHAAHVTFRNFSLYTADLKFYEFRRS